MPAAFDAQQEYILENDAVLLRPLQESDYDLLLPFALNEPELWRFSLVQAAGTEGLKHYLQLALIAREKGTEYPFIVYDKVQQAWAGSTRFYDIQPAHQTLQLGYTWYGKAHQGTGLNKHCKYLLLQVAFEQWGMERVEFRADAENSRSLAAMRSIGCTMEGILRSNGLRPDGTRRNSAVLSILRSEWVHSVKAMLMKKIGSSVGG